MPAACSRSDSGCGRQQTLEGVAEAALLQCADIRSLPAMSEKLRKSRRDFAMRRRRRAFAIVRRDHQTREASDRGGGQSGGDRRPRARSPEGAHDTYRTGHDEPISAALTSANVREAEPQES